MSKAVMIMSALVPTKGHGYLIEWGNRFVRNAKIGKLLVLVCSTAAEPLQGGQRVAALRRAFLKEINSGSLEIQHVEFHPSELPEHPNPDVALDITFWAKWTNFIRTHAGICDYYLGSEKWGKTLADFMGAYFIPCDPNREILRVKGTGVRNDPIDNFAQILDEVQPIFRKTLTIFGAESTGKTTLAKQLADKHGHYVHEWARPYLENTAPETTEEKMKVIAYGQRAAEDTVSQFTNKPFIFRDTDILSTLGFYRLYYKSEPKWLRELFRPADHYLLTQSNIPFEKDILRYGGNKREASDEFWEQMLIDYGVPYTIIRATSHAGRRYEAEQVANNLFMSHPVWDYVRQGNT